MFSSVRGKFTVWFVCTFIFLILLTFGLTETLFQMFAIKSIDQSLIKGVSTIEKNIVQCVDGMKSKPGALVDCINRNIQTIFPREVVFVQLLEVDNNDSTKVKNLARSYTLSDKTLPFASNTLDLIFANKYHFSTLDQLLGSEVRVISKTVEPRSYKGKTVILQFAIPTGESETGDKLLVHPFAIRQHIFLALLPLILIIVMIWGYFFMKRVFSPVRDLVEVTRKITAENLSQRIDPGRSNDEISELAETLNGMISRLDSSFKQIRQFSGDVSHELKTPLTAIKGEIEVTLRKSRSEEEYKEVLLSLLEEINYLTKIVDNLLFLSRLDSKSFHIGNDSVDPGSIMMELYENFYRLAKDRGVTINILSADSSVIAGDAGLIRQLFSNLLLNSIKYTPGGGTIDISVEKDQDRSLFTIKDSGVGIPCEDFDKVFDRFYRVDSSRSKDTGGSGLGLAIAKKIVEVHGGEITLKSKVGEGSEFKVFLKLTE